MDDTPIIIRTKQLVKKLVGGVSMVELIGWLAIGAAAFYFGYLKGQGKI